MDRYFRETIVTEGTRSSPPSEVLLFAQAILGKPISRPDGALVASRARRAQLEWLATISDRHRDEVRRLQSAEAEARRQRQQLEWLAQISEEHERKLRVSLREEADRAEAQRRYERLVEDLALQEAQWDPAKHPRRGGPPNAGWFATTSGSGSAAVSSRARSTPPAQPAPDRQPEELTVTPAMIQSTGWLGGIREKLRDAGKIASAFVAGLGTGAKAVVNGLATAARSVATLGLYTDQLELIGVSKEDRERGYDTAVTISTGSGQVLIAVGTGGMASALAKGGTIARAASGTLVAYDAAGNAVGVVQGVYDATQNGVTLANGTKIAAGALGITANVGATKGLVNSRPRAPDAPAQITPSTRPAKSPAVANTPASEFRVDKHGDMPSPRPRQHSHHGVMSEWMKNHFPGYDPKKAPAVLMPDANHMATYGVYNTWRAEARRESGGAFDWSQISENGIRSLSEEMFDAADVPANVREEYWAEFERMKSALKRQRRSQSLEAILWREQDMTSNADVLSADEMKQRYGSFYDQSQKLRLDRTKVPQQLWPLLPYAEFWGFADDWTRQDLVEQAPPDVQRNLKAVVSTFDDAFDDWLAGPEAAGPNFSEEYIAFTALRMAADFV
jgi:hypothetical protein